VEPRTKKKKKDPAPKGERLGKEQRILLKKKIAIGSSKYHLRVNGKQPEKHITKKRRGGDLKKRSPEKGVRNG